MKTLAVNIPNHKVNFFKRLITEMGCTYNEIEVAPTSVAEREKTLASIDNAFKELKQMNEGKIEGIPAEELLNEL
ncbi:MAG: hypothetical protein IKR17_10970 [Bacteroidales bacterium]|nr:hypothetical protein [Bacteroidales bacterium]